MPVEKELKYVLEGNPIKLFKKFGNLPGAVTYDMTQGYLDKNCRIRRTKKFVPKGGFTQINEFTFKMMVNGNQIEVETVIDDRDFNALWTRVERTLTKFRIKVPHGDYVWEIDFFYEAMNPEEYYFIMAEVEIPEDEDAPKAVPDFIKEHLLHEVPMDDNRFKSKNLTKASYAKALLQEIKDGKHQSS